MHHSEELARDALQQGTRVRPEVDADESLSSAIRRQPAPAQRPFLSPAAPSLCWVTTFAAATPRRATWAGRRDGSEREISQPSRRRSSKEAAATLGIRVKTIEAHPRRTSRKAAPALGRDLVRDAIRTTRSWSLRRMERMGLVECNHRLTRIRALRLYSSFGEKLRTNYVAPTEPCLKSSSHEYRTSHQLGCHDVRGETR